MQRVRAALRHDIDIAAQRTAELRLAAARHDLKLLNGIDTKSDAAESSGIVVGRDPVDDETVGEVALARNRDPLSRDCGRFSEELRAVRIRR